VATEKETETRQAAAEKAEKPRGRIRRWYDRNRLGLQISTLIFLFLVVYLAPNIFIAIHSGEGGVLWSRFFGGTRTEGYYHEGLRVIFPWDVMYVYNLRLQELTTTYQVLSADGLEMEVEVSLRYRLIADHLGVLHKNIGPDYVNVLLIPELGSHARRQMALYEPDELYTAKRAMIQEEIRRSLHDEIRVRYHPKEPRETPIHVEDVLIRRILLPPTVKEAIQNKLAQKHVMLEYDYRLQKEEKEKERKRIEAEGIHLFQTTVSEGISDRYLRWKGIDATLELARSPNAKVVVIGAGDEGLPLILGNFEGPPPEEEEADAGTGEVTDYPGQ
jgi:regulator of protease activity HflC (stomatin/prohibitin superfamily)